MERFHGAVLDISTTRYMGWFYLSGIKIVLICFLGVYWRYGLSLFDGILLECKRFSLGCEVIWSSTSCI
jgi:hypothetical protein